MPWAVCTFFTSQSESGVHHLKRLNASLFGHHTAGSDFAGGDQTDVDACIRQRTEHAPCCAGRCRHPRAHSTHPGNGLTILQSGTGPLGQQGGQGHVGAGAVVLAQDEGDVARSVAVLTFRLNDRIEADAVVRQG